MVQWWPWHAGQAVGGFFGAIRRSRVLVRTYLPIDCNKGAGDVFKKDRAH